MKGPAARRSGVRAFRAALKVQRLEEMRLLTVEDRIDAELGARSASTGMLCAELGTLTSENPLRSGCADS